MKTITTQNLAESTEQEVFDFVAHHLLTQMKKSHLTEGGCMYRSPEGLACAAGCLLTDEEATKADHLGVGGHSTYWDTVVFSGLVPDVHRKLISGLQEIHDGSPPSAWSMMLREFANDCKLNTDIIASFAS